MRHFRPDRAERFLLIGLLAALAVAQPLFNLLGEQAEFLVAHDLRGLRLVVFAVVLGLLLPLAVAALPALASRLDARMGSALHYALFLLLVALIALPAVNRLEIAGPGALMGAALCAVAALSLYHRSGPVRLFFRYLAPAALVFPMMFLLFSRATPLLAGDTTDDATTALGTTPPIVFLVLDEFPIVSLLTPELEINRQRFPNFARLADQSNWYLAATTGAEVTVDAVPEALTGIAAKPDRNSLPISANFPNNLFTLLGEHYFFHVTETNTRLCPRELCLSGSAYLTGLGTWQLMASDLWLVFRHLAWPRPWADELPPVSNGWAGFGQEDADLPARNEGVENAIAVADLATQVDWSARSVQLEAFIDRIERTETPQLHFFHSLLPHRVWRLLPDGRQYLVDETWEALDDPGLEHGDFVEAAFGHIWQDDPIAVQTARKRHLLQVQYVDTLLGRLLDRLEAQGMLADSLLVVLGDHGASFIPGQPRRAITQKSRSDIAGVPLFIKLPGQTRGDRITTPARLLDVLPTIADILEAQPNWPWDGATLLGPVPPGRDLVRVKSNTGAPLVYPAVAHLEHLQARAAEFDRVYGQGAVINYLNFAWADELLGRSPRDFAKAADAPGKAFLDHPQLYRDVNPSGGFVPLHLKGWLEEVPEALLPAELAIAINGVLQAAARTFDIPGFALRFEALLPPDSLRAGENTVQIFRVDRGATGVQLVELSRPLALDYRVVLRDDGEYIVDEAQYERYVQAGQAGGQVASFEPEQGGLVNLAGSLAPEAANVERIAAFANGRLVGLGKAEQGQFTFPVSGVAAQDPRQLNVRVFALGRYVAFELSYPGACSAHWHFAPPAAWGDTDCAATAHTPLRWSPGGYRGALDFTNPAVRPFLKSGWVLEAGNLSWTVHQRAELVIPLPENAGALRMRARVRPFLVPPALPRQAVYVLANDQPVGEFALDSAELQTIEWAVPPQLLAMSPGELRISLLLPDAASPQSLGAGSDLRLLGLAFRELLIESTSSQD